MGLTKTNVHITGGLHIVGIDQLLSFLGLPIFSMISNANAQGIADRINRSCNNNHRLWDEPNNQP
jgi:hypothetical protein